ncbi:hypothetical protein DU508_06015 [Pedobacter chinensis]|uniref:Uncharacterized protein n=1 Tax=Pedobacter chinensis TaxID=2282421 RepID=A0A369Q178_9SPHI|nr:hypothetical protein DU508_06015 [Pedobacter chinensis]
MIYHLHFEYIIENCCTQVSDSVATTLFYYPNKILNRKGVNLLVYFELGLIKNSVNLHASYLLK